MKKVTTNNIKSKAIPSFLINVKITKKQKANKKYNVSFPFFWFSIISKYIRRALSEKYTATNPSAHPLNKYFPIVKKTKNKKNMYLLSLKKIYIKISGGKNINVNEIFGSTSFQKPKSVANEDEKAGANEG